jgi:hypothetical protein
VVASQGSQWVSKLVFILSFQTLRYKFRIDAQWIVAKKDWREAKKRCKEQEKQRDNTTPDRTASASTSNHDITGEEPNESESGTYQQDMDEMRCILYAHGGEPACSSVAQLSTNGYCY